MAFLGCFYLRQVDIVYLVPAFSSQLQPERFRLGRVNEFLK